MGTSKMHREGPAWQDSYTAQSGGGHTKGYKGTGAEGTHMSGGGYGRMGMSAGARKKSRSGRTTVRAKVPSGQS